MSCGHHRRIVDVPIIVEPVVVPVPLPVIEVQIKRVAIAVRTAENSYKMPSLPPPFEYSQGCIVFGIIIP